MVVDDRDLSRREVKDRRRIISRGKCELPCSQVNTSPVHGRYYSTCNSDCISLGCNIYNRKEANEVLTSAHTKRKR